jgi:D-alanine transaminase
MPRVAYVNGRYVPHAAASVHVEDRGYQFGDGVYEAFEVRGGAIVDLRRHLDRLDRSLGELSIAAPMGRAALTQVLGQVVRRNRIADGVLYMQVTRGVARRDHYFPTPAVRPSLVVTARPLDPSLNAKRAEEGIAVVTVPDDRWGRVDIKTVGLLPNVLAKQRAREAGAREAWFVGRDGFVTEGGSSNAWIVDRNGVLVTRPHDHAILNGITRQVAMALAEREGIRVELRGFTVAEAQAAREAFITSAGQIVMPVTRIDDKPVGNGAPGLVAGRLRALYHELAELHPVLSPRRR